MPRAKKTTAAVKPPRQKPGPKPKPLSERVYKPSKPIQRIENSYSQKRKEEVILYLLNHTIYDPDSWKSVDCYRKPFQREASRHFKIPEATIHTWWKNRASILSREKKKRKKRGEKDQPAPDEGEAPVESSTTGVETAEPITAESEAPEAPASEMADTEPVDQESIAEDAAAEDDVSLEASEMQDE